MTVISFIIIYGAINVCLTLILRIISKYIKHSIEELSVGFVIVMWFTIFPLYLVYIWIVQHEEKPDKINIDEKWIKFVLNIPKKEFNSAWHESIETVLGENRFKILQSEYKTSYSIIIENQRGTVVKEIKVKEKDDYRNYNKLKDFFKDIKKDILYERDQLLFEKLLVDK